MAGLYKGADAITAAYKGADAVTGIYKGAELVWPVAAVTAWKGIFSDAVDRGSYTFTNVPIGAPDPNRRVLVLVVNEKLSFNSDPSAVTIGGVAATLATNESSDDISGRAFYATVPTGEEVTISVGMSATGANCVIGVWSFVSASANPTLSVSNDTNSINVSVADGDLFCGIVARDVAPTTWTPSWSGADDVVVRADDDVENASFAFCDFLATVTETGTFASGLGGFFFSGRIILATRWAL